MFSNIGTGELLIIFLIFIVLFGAKKIPDLAQGLGKGIREFKKAMNEAEDTIKSEIKNTKEDVNKSEQK